MPFVIGTAGHIDHGKTTLLRALTGIDADRLPEEQARGMTIDVGYAHVALDDGTVLDFVDVPGHDRLIGNMLVGAGEIDAALLVVAADDGPRAQTREHLDLLDALGIDAGIAVVTKADAVDVERAAQVVDEVRALLAPTTLAGAALLVVSATTGQGLDDLRAALRALARSREGTTTTVADAPRLAIDRVFSIRGRGTVVTGTLRGGTIARGAVLRVVPDGAGRTVRVREVQVHGRTVEVASAGRVALNVAGSDAAATLERGKALTTDLAVVSSDRILVALRPSTLAASDRPGRSAPDRLPADRTPVSVHLGTARVAGVVGRSGRDAVALPDGTGTAILRLDRAVAVAPGDPLVIRRQSPAETLAGGRILDPEPARGVARRRTTAERLERLAAAPPGSEAWHAARLELHGATRSDDGRVILADDVASTVDAAIRAGAAVRTAVPVAELLRVGAGTLRRAVGAGPRDRAPDAALQQAVAGRLDRLVAAGDLDRHGDVVRVPGSATGPSPGDIAAMGALERLLDTTTPPALSEAARTANCGPDLVATLERTGRIIRIDTDLAWADSAYRSLMERALAMATTAPLTPAAFRDATGSSRKYVMAILEDLDRRAVLRRTPAGHVPGPRAAAGLPPVAAAAR